MRTPAELMTPERLAALQPTRLSASRSLLNVMTARGWKVERTRFDLDDRGNGTAVYRVVTHAGELTFAAFGSEPSLVDRTPRIIGRSWDMVGALMEGEADAARLEHTAREMPKLYAGRAAPGTLVWCRSNRSLRAFDHTVGALADGRRPGVGVLREIGYLMRNTGLDGNGTFGTRSFLSYGPEHPLSVPYHAQMLTAYLMREFSFDLAEHLARAASPRAIGLPADLRRYLGLGNGSGLGLALFIANHPRMVHRWLELRERALDAARELSGADAAARLEPLRTLLERAIVHRDQDPMRYTVFPGGRTVAEELRGVRDRLAALDPAAHDRPLDHLRTQVRGTVTAETEEVLDGLLIEIVPEVADGLLPELTLDETLAHDPAMTAGELAGLLDGPYRWALDMPLADRRSRVWYKSQAAEEPRSGPREEFPGGFDLTVDVPGDARRLRKILGSYAAEARVGRLLFDHPDQRAAVARFQALRAEPYALPRMDMRDLDFVPARVIRLGNGAFYGLDRTKDFLGRTLRGLIFQGAPGRDELATADGASWWHPALPGAEPALPGEAPSPAAHLGAENGGPV